MALVAFQGLNSMNKKHHQYRKVTNLDDIPYTIFTMLFLLCLVQNYGVQYLN